MALQDHETESQNNHLDVLFCEEEYFVEGEECDESSVVKDDYYPFVLLQERDLVWEGDELVTLLIKEKDTFVYCTETISSDGGVMMARKWAVEWLLRVNSHYGFSALTSVLAVNYFDRFVTSFRFQRDKPWMNQLAAVACLSLAAKVEETQVPLLLDLQVEDSKYVFEAKTIQRMELLVLSNLQWKMHPVTPISFFDHIVRRLGLKTNLHWEFLTSCETILLSVIADSRYMSYPPSVLACAIMLFVIQEIERCDLIEYQNQLTEILKINEEQVDSCYELIMEVSHSHGQIQYESHKRKFPSVPVSPIGVIDMSFSCDSSNDSWAVASSISTSLEPPFKRNRVQDQQMRLSLPTRVSMDVLGSPH